MSSSSILASLQGIAWNRDWDWSQTRIDDAKIENDFEYSLVVEREGKRDFQFKDFQVSEGPLKEQASGGISSSSSSSGSDLRTWVKSFSETGGLVSVAPGLEKGLDSTNVVSQEEAPDLSMTLFNSYARLGKQSMVLAESASAATEKQPLENNRNDADADADNDIDGLLGDAADSLSTILGKRKTDLAEDEAAKKTWAHVIDVSTQFLNFKELVPEMAHKVKL